MKKTLFWFVSVIFIISMIFAGVACKTNITSETTAAEAATEATTAAETTAAETTAAAAPVTLTIWVAAAGEAVKNMFVKYEQDTGNKLDIVTFPSPHEEPVLAKWVAGDRPDILDWAADYGSLLKLNPTETLQDLTDMEFVKKVKNNYLGPLTIDGKIYTFIQDSAYVSGMTYNKEVFASLGLEIPANSAELFNLLKTIKANGNGIAPIYSAGGIMWPLQFIPMVYIADATKNTKLADELNTNQASYTDERLVGAYQFEKDIFDAGLFNGDIMTATYEGEVSNVFEGKAAMVCQSTYTVGAMVDAYGIDEVNKKIGFFTISKDDNAADWALSTAYVAPKTGNAEKEKAAREFLNWLYLNHQYYVDQAKLAPVFEGFNIPDNIPTAFVEAYGWLDKDPVADLGLFLHAPGGDISTYLNEMLAGTKTPQQVGEAMQKDWETNAKAVGLEGF
jgi:raffinose/stachyose/melibiose transport system substrate-binding protein